jgi:hypothetical protein
MPDNKVDISSKLADDISSDVGNSNEDELSSISSSFNKTLNDALKVFNSSLFDNNGFIKRLQDIELGDTKDKNIMKNVLNTMKHEYVDIQALHHSELLLRRDLSNICSQMPEMRDVIYVVRDAIIECNVSTGEVSRSLTFENQEDTPALESQCKDIENKYDLLMAIKNFIIPRTLTVGEMYIHVVPFSKLFAELEAIKDTKIYANKQHRSFREDTNTPTAINSIYNEKNVKYLMESITIDTKIDSSDTYKMENNVNAIKDRNFNELHLTTLLQNISVANNHSVMMEELGVEGFQELLFKEYNDNKLPNSDHFIESMKKNTYSIYDSVPEESIDLSSYKDIKGCYIKYLDALRVVPIRIDRKVIGYYYVSTTMDLQVNPAHPNGIIDLSFQHYTKDRNLVDNLANIIIKSFDKKMLEKNIKLKNEIAEIIMAHKFSEGRLSFVYIPENEIIRLIVNEDEDSRGHSILEPTIFPARMYLMLTLYNMLYTLNNTTTRIHYLRSSGLNKDYAAQIQRTMRKFQSRRITIDDIYSYSGVLNKIGGMGEMVLPSGRGDYKALETDTLEPVNNPISIEFLEQQRRQAISGTGVPHLTVINAIDEVDFAKTLEMSNARFISTASSYKIDFNRGLTKLYRLILKYNTDIPDDVINSFRFQFSPIKQQELSITSDMITNFNTLAELVGSIYFSPDMLQTKNGQATNLQINLRKELAKEYLPQLDFDQLETIVSKVNIDTKGSELQDKINDSHLDEEDVKNV